MAEIFDQWPEKYDRWFETPTGRLVKQYESRLLLEMVRPGHGEKILDAGCGTGVFTADLLAAGARVTGLELSLPMLRHAGKKAPGQPFLMVQGDMRRLPFASGAFDKTVSVTAIEFLHEDAPGAVAEMLRVTRPDGLVVVASLNSLSPWAAGRKAKAKEHPIFAHTLFRSPSEMAELAHLPVVIRTAVHFQKHEDLSRAVEIETDGDIRELDTGAFLVACWKKPAKL